MRRRLVAIGAVAVLCGCGSSGPSKQQYVAKADRICHAHDVKLEPVTRRYNTAAKAGNAGKAANALDHAIAIGAGQLRDLRALDPPGDQKEEVTQQLDLVRRQLQLINGLEQALKARNGKTMQRLGTQIRATAGAYRKRAKAFGYKVCGRGA